VHYYGASRTLDKGDCSVFYRLIDVTHEEDLDRIWRDVWESRKIIRGEEMEAHEEQKKAVRRERRMRASVTWRI